MAQEHDNKSPAAPQLPAPGWYPDPAGAGQRWWDGQRWTEQVGPLPPARESEPPPGAAPAAPPAQSVGGGGRGRRFRVGLAVLAVVLVGGLVALITSGSNGDAQAAYSECQRDSRPTFAAMQELGSHLDVGVVQADYAAEVGDVQATYDRLDSRRVSPACAPVVAALGEAMDSYALASSEWNECIVSAEECGEGSTQSLWLDADRAVARATHRLRSLAAGGDAVAAAEAEAAQVEADALAKEQGHTALVVMETYATDHEGSYEGATPGKLGAIEPSLPAGIEVAEAGFDYFSISIPSKGGNWFEIDREIGGELVFKCGEQGRAGCPGNGSWG
jgi:hypothetical protein